MLKKLKNLLTNNIGLKFLSVLFAMILWLVVVNIDDPDKTSTFTTNITIANENAIADMGKSYSIINDSGTVTFRVTAKRSIIERLTNSDFKATADMENIELHDDGTAIVPIDISAVRYSSQLDIDRKKKNLELAVEDLQSNQFKITAEATGTPAEGSAVGELKVSPDVLTISGPASVVSQISKVQAVIDVSEKFSDVEDNVVPVVYDASGNTLDTSKLTFSQDTVQIKAQILSVKEIPINCETGGELESGYQQISVECEPKKIKVMGTAEKLNKITMITIPGEALDISGAKETLTKDIDISTSKLTFSQDTVQIKAQILSVKEIPINCETGGELESGYQQISVECEPKKIKVMGTAEKLNKITMITIPGEALDISGAKETLTKDIDISTYLPDGVTLVDSSQAKVKVTIAIEQTETKNFNVPVKNIKIFNLSDDCSIEYQGDKIPVTLKGYTSDLESLSAEDVMLSVDASGVQPGTNTLPLTLNLGSGYTLVEDSVVTINVVDQSEKQQDTNTDSESKKDNNKEYSKKKEQSQE